MNHSPQRILTCDVIIIGAGPVGVTVGYGLAKAGLTVALVDSLSLSAMLERDFDGRTSAISHGSHLLLKKLDLWEALEEYTQPILDIRISDKGASNSLDYHHGEVGAHPMGYIIENPLFRRMLYTRASTLPQLSWHAPDTLAAFERSSKGVRAELKSGTTIQARLCIGADGRNSHMRDLAAIPVTRWAYSQAAIVCVVEHESPHYGMAFEHFMPSGPLAFLPMKGNRSSVVWSEQKEVIPLRMRLCESDFGLLLHRKFGSILGDIQLASKRWTYPLEALMAHRYYDQRLALVGDAAHVIHPIAGQGLNLGLRDAAALVDVLLDAHRLGLDIGSLTVLERYQRGRRLDALSLLSVTDGLNRLFSNTLPPLRFLRSAGLGILQQMPWAKRFLMRRAMGMGGVIAPLKAGKAL